MSKFNTATPTVTRTRKGNTTNLAGGEAFSQTAELEFASILLTSFVKDQYYRSADGTVARLKELLGSVDPEFAAKAAVFARDEFGMRSISHVVAGELAHAVKGEPWTKDFFNRVVVRPDDMTEILAYYLGNYGKPVPNAVKKGFGQAIGRFDGYQLAKYRASDKNVSLVDVVNLVRPRPTDKNREALKALVEGTLRNTNTWESRLSAAGSDTDAKADVWAGLMEEGRMPYFALLRNLRNIEQTGNDELIKRAAKQLVEDDPGSHRVLPFRFLSAYNEVTDRRLVKAVSDALDRATVNVPDLPGKTLIAIDHSGSMGYFQHGSPKFIADTFAAIVFKAMEADVISFGTTAGYVKGLNPGDSTLTIAKAISGVDHGHGTNFEAIFSTADKKYDRVFIFSDMQAWIGGGNTTGPLASYERKTKAKPFVYAFDLAGYGSAQFNPNSERFYQLAGFSEKVFDLAKVVEQDRNALVNKIKETSLTR